MPIHTCTLTKSGKGFKWGGHGKCYPSEKKAEEQSVAAHAHGFTGDDDKDERTRRVAGILFIRKKKVLLLRRSKKEKNDAHMWDLPGGHLDEGETSIQAAAREFNEECGIVLDNPDELILISKMVYPYEYTTYAGFVDDKFKPKLNDEHDDYGWFKQKDLPKNVHPKLMPVLDTFFKDL